MRSNKRKEGKPSHIVSAWSREDGFCLGQRAVEEKNNETTAIPELLDKIQVKGQIITTDAMGTQERIAKKIRKKCADNVLAVKGNQAGLYEDVKLYFGEEKIREEIREKKNYTCTVEKARGQMEKREYYQTEEIRWLQRRKEWSLNILKMIELMKPGLSMKKKRFVISLHPIKYLEEVLLF